MTIIYVKAYTREDGTHVRAHTREIDGNKKDENYYKSLRQSSNDLSEDIWSSVKDFCNVDDEDMDVLSRAVLGNGEAFGGFYDAIPNSSEESTDRMILEIDSLLKQSKKDFELLKTIREKAGLGNTKDKMCWQNNATREDEEKYKEKTGNEPPLTLEEANNILTSLREKYSINGRVYGQMTRDEKRTVEYIYSKFKLPPMDLLKIDKNKIPQSLKDKAKVFYNADLETKKDFVREFTDFAINSSGAFKDEESKPKLSFSDKIHDYAQYDYGKNEIIINEDYLSDLWGIIGGKMKEISNSVLEEVSHAVISKHPNHENDPRITLLKNAERVYAFNTENETLYNNNPNEVVAKWNAKKNDKYMTEYASFMTNPLTIIKALGKSVLNVGSHTLPDFYEGIKNKIINFIDDYK